MEGPQFLDQAILQLGSPLAREECDDLISPVNKLRAIAPAAVDGVREGNLLWILGVPAILGCTNLEDGCFQGEGRRQIGSWAQRIAPVPSVRPRRLCLDR